MFLNTACFTSPCQLCYYSSHSTSASWMYWSYQIYTASSEMVQWDRT